MGYQKESAQIVSQDVLAENVYSMWIATGMARQAVPGQFISVFSKDGSRLLPRPISICEINKEENRLRIVYRVVGAGTCEFSKYRCRHSISIMGPLGNGFPLPPADFRQGDAPPSDRTALLVGGGIGVPPMLELAKQLTGKRKMVLGYRDQLFLNQEFKAYGPVYLATENGSAGTKGTVLDAIREHHLEADVIYACGPTPMLRAVKAYANEHGIECWLSLEEKMACGIGACLACVCQTKAVDTHSNVNNRRICKDGPVFLAEEVEL